MGPKKSPKPGVAPAKTNQQVGKIVKYIGLFGRTYTCSVCNRVFKRGFFWEQGVVNACSQTCLKTITEA